MREIDQALVRIRKIADQKGGKARLAQEAAVPYTTVHSFAQRAWSNKNIDILGKLADAAARIEARDAA